MGYKERIASGFMSKNDYNCAETMLNGANEEYGLQIGETGLKAACAFGGGMGVERACGALTGGLMALGCMYARDRSHRDKRMTEIRDHYVKSFVEHFGSSECDAIKKSHKDEKTGCQPVVAQAAEILQRTVEQVDQTEAAAAT